MPDPPEKSAMPEIHPMKPRTSRLFITVLLLCALAAAILAAVIVIENSKDPELQQRIEKAQRMQKGLPVDGPPVDTTRTNAPDTTQTP